MKLKCHYKSHLPCLASQSISRNTKQPFGYAIDVNLLVDTVLNLGTTMP